MSQTTPKFLTGEIKSPPIKDTKNDTEFLKSKPFSRDEYEKVVLQYVDDPIFKFLPFPRWFRKKHRALLGITNDEKQRLKEEKEAFNTKLAFETNQSNIDKLVEEHNKTTKTMMKKAQKRIGKNKKSRAV